MRSRLARSKNNVELFASSQQLISASNSVSRLKTLKPISDKLQNIALAHLLVTHILLWLMRLNSISLFQASEQQAPTRGLVDVMSNDQHHYHPSSQFDGHPRQRPAVGPSSGNGSLDSLTGSADDNKERQQNNRSELESILRRKLPRFDPGSPRQPAQATPAPGAEPPGQSTGSTPPASLDGHKTREPERPSGSTGAAGKQAGDVSSTTSPLPANDAASKGEVRGLRSAGRLSPETPATNFGGDKTQQANEPTHEPARPAEHADKTSGQQRAKPVPTARPSLATNPPPPAGPGGQLDSVTQVSAVAQLKQSPDSGGSKLLGAELRPNITANLFRSSLPKRMTAFRQGRPNQRAPGATTGPPDFVSSPPTKSASSTTTRSPLPPVVAPGGPSKQMADEDNKQVSPRHRVRILVSRGEELPVTDLSAVIRLNSNHSANISRPFPSVDQDPPRRTTSAFGPDERGSDASTTTPEKSVSPDKNRPVGVDEDADSRGGADSGEDEEPSGSQSDADEAEIDLDSLLPPVPSYNDTGDEEAPPREPAARRSRTMPLSGPAESNKTKHLGEEPFAFDEAATSEMSVSTTPASSLARDQKGGAPGNGSGPAGVPDATGRQPNRQAGPEALARGSGERPADQDERPTFADFLLPLVQQYHILILTILFNMWLDNMRDCGERVHCATSAGRHLVLARHWPARDALRPAGSFKGSGRSGSVSPTPPPSSSSELSDSASRSSSTKQLVAVPVAGPRWPHASPLHSGRRDSSASPTGSHSLRRSISSDRLLWLGANKELRARRLLVRPTRSLAGSLALAPAGRSQAEPDGPKLEAHAASSVCSVFCGLLVISASLIVILVGVELVSLLTQCLTQTVSILACLVGLCIIWRLDARNRRAGQLPGAHCSPAHRNIFHFLFLLAAYYCGISTALNLGHQHHPQHLFPQQVLQFIRRHLSDANEQPGLAQLGPHQAPAPIPLLANYQLLFHAALALKGLVLVVQVTLQTVLIRSSWRHAKCELRQVYTFLMFANLSLWALEICDQQQLVQARGQRAPDAASGAPFELLSLDGFTRFAGSVVTLSHLYHGLVFMQH